MEDASISSLLYPAINFAILVAAMFYYLKAPTKTFVKARHDSLKEELDRVQAKLVDAQKQYQEYSQRLSAMDAEITSLVQSVRSDAESAKVRVLTEARRSADQLDHNINIVTSGELPRRSRAARASAASA